MAANEGTPIVGKPTSIEGLTHYSVVTENSGTLSVYTQGDKSTAEVFILTVHDLGCNHTSWLHFVEHPCMEQIASRTLFIHVNVPGMDDNAADLEAGFVYPTMDQIGHDLINVLYQLQIHHVIGLGEGAGANIIARFALAHPNHCDGVILIHCTGTTAGFMESIRDRIITHNLESGITSSAESYLVLHRFGDFQNLKTKEELDAATAEFCKGLHETINSSNLKRYIETFLKRKNLTERMHDLKVHALFMTGACASFNHTVHTLYGATLHALQSGNRKMVELIEVNDVSNVVAEAPQKLAEGILYFIQGLGRLPALRMTNIPKGGLKMRTMSMEAADLPRNVVDHLVGIAENA